MDAGSPFSTRRTFCVPAPINEFSFFFTFVVLIFSIIHFRLFPKPKYCHQRYLLLREPWTFQTKFCQILLQGLCVVMPVAALVFALQFAVKLEDRAVEKYNAICVRRLCDQALEPSNDHGLRKVCRLLILHHFCNHESFNYHQLLQLPLVLDLRQNWRKICKVQARSSLGD